MNTNHLGTWILFDSPIALAFEKSVTWKKSDGYEMYCAWLEQDHCCYVWFLQYERLLEHSRKKSVWQAGDSRNQIRHYLSLALLVHLQETATSFCTDLNVFALHTQIQTELCILLWELGKPMMMLIAISAKTQRRRTWRVNFEPRGKWELLLLSRDVFVAWEDEENCRKCTSCLLWFLRLRGRVLLIPR